MSWWGKIIGGAFGLMLGGPLGAMLGTVIGHNFDKGLKESQQQGGRHERVQLAFFTAAFSVMGYVCKADGRVSEDEIALARDVMRQMDLNPEQKKTAIRLFNEGKKKGFLFHDVMQQFRREAGYQPNLYRMFLEIQIMAAYADGIMDKAEHRLLLEISQLLNFPQREFEHLCMMIGGLHSGQPNKATRSAEVSLDKAYAILDIKRHASEEEIKRAYRKLISQHHPDKLVAKGLPDEMMKLATERTHEIRQAYERIKEARGF